MACPACGNLNPVVYACWCPSKDTVDPLVLRSHYNPQETSEMREIHSFVESAESSLVCIDSDIANVQTILQRLFLKRSLLRTTIDSHKSLLSPIRRLPNELLSEIFLSRHSSSTTSPFINLHDDILWTILQVCALWRSTALSTPRLWNTILIDLTPLKGKPSNYARLHTRLQTCLSHSDALSLNFALTGTHYQDSAHLVPLITTLCTHSHKWVNVYFCPYTTNILARWLPAYRHLSTPQLTSLALTSFNPSPGFIQTPTRFSHTPSLTRLALYDYRTRPNTEPSFLPSFCHQLTHLYLDSCPYYTYDDILPHVPSLVYLEIFNKYQHSARAPDITPISLPNLRSFKATGWLGNLCFLLPHLKLPAIQSIDVTALEEQCHPCTCGVVKRRIINDWVETLKRDAQVRLHYAPGLAMKTSSTDSGIIPFLFSSIE